MIVKALNNFLENFHAVLSMRGMTQREIAERMGCSYTFLSRVLSGKSEPSMVFCGRAADAIGVEFGELIKEPRKFKDSLLTNTQVTR